MVHNDQYYRNLEKKLGVDEDDEDDGFVKSSGGGGRLTQRERQALTDRQERKVAINAEYQSRMRDRYGW